MPSRLRRAVLFGIPSLLALGIVGWLIGRSTGKGSPEPQRAVVREGALEVLSVPRQ